VGPVEPKGPLEGITVIDLSRVLAGPYCTMVLADLGARVIKVEIPERGDDARHIGPFINGRSAYFASANRGKESVALDLSLGSADRAAFERLLDSADVLVENFRPGVMDRLGYGWTTVHERWPSLVYASTSGFGQTGPASNRPAYDMVVQGMGGIMSITGHPDSAPTRVGTSIGDITAGLFTAVGICSALFARAANGAGVHVDVAMLDCQVAILENAIARLAATGIAPGPMGSRHPSITPFAAFKAADGHLILAAGNDGLFAKLCSVLGIADVALEARFATNDLRNQNEPALRDALERALVTQPVAEWLERLMAADLPCGPINDVAQVMADEQVLARNMVVTVDDPVMGMLRLAGNPIKLSGYPDPSTRPPAPDLDADRAAVLET
jgi:CoA:oxalate CoA-transferase